MSRFLSSLSLVLAFGWAVMAAAAAPAGAGPELFLSTTIRDGSVDGIEPGMPVRVAVRIEQVSADRATIELAPASSTWADCVHLELVPVGSTKASARANPIGQPDSPKATLTKGRVATGFWRFSAAETQKLAPGEYELRATLEIRAGAGWTGTCEAEPVPVTVVAPTDAPERVSARALARAQDEMVDGRTEAAATTLDTLLRSQPDNLRAWMLRGALCERGGNVMGALECLNRAQRFYASLGLRAPHVQLETIYGRVLAALAGAPDPAALPAWSSPAFELFALADQRIQEVEPKRTAPTPAQSTPVAPAAAVVTPPSRAVGPSPAVAAPVVSPPAARTAPPPGAVVPLEQVKEAEILKDTAGQWAQSAKASSEYGPSDYSARQATGAPDVPAHADDKRAWSASASERNPEWLELTYARAVRATEVRVRQSLNPGTIVRIEAFAPDGSAHVLWAGKDPNAYPKDQIAWLVVRFPRTEFLVQRVKVTLDMPAAKGWKQIDAVQLVGE